MRAYIESGKLVCPVCEKSKFHYGSFIRVYRRLVSEEGKIDSGVLLVLEDRDSEYIPDDSDPHLDCLECWERRELPEGLEIKFV